MSSFAQPVPDRFQQGDWDTRRAEVARVALVIVAVNAQLLRGIEL